ncbi:unnamed protein product [[Candida] boidinii]|nr:unnamed protein product [[Candida] boidinii]
MIQFYNYRLYQIFSLKPILILSFFSDFDDAANEDGAGTAKDSAADVRAALSATAVVAAAVVACPFAEVTLIEEAEDVGSVDSVAFTAFLAFADAASAQENGFAGFGGIVAGVLDGVCCADVGGLAGVDGRSGNFFNCGGVDDVFSSSTSGAVSGVDSFEVSFEVKS